MREIPTRIQKTVVAVKTETERFIKDEKGLSVPEAGFYVAGVLLGAAGGIEIVAGLGQLRIVGPVGPGGRSIMNMEMGELYDTGVSNLANALRDGGLGVAATAGGRFIRSVEARRGTP